MDEARRARREGRLIGTVAVVAVLSLFSLQIWYESRPKNYKIKVVDGCEYIVNKVRGDEVLTHKGDCKNKKHKNGN